MNVTHNLAGRPLIGNMVAFVPLRSPQPIQQGNLPHQVSTLQ
jgi:hypothetical protein